MQISTRQLPDTVNAENYASGLLQDKRRGIFRYEENDYDKVV
jgi:hypothetical protein